MVTVADAELELDRVIAAMKVYHKREGHPPIELHLDLRTERGLAKAAQCRVSDEMLKRLKSGGLRAIPALLGMKLVFDVPKLKIV